MTDKDQSRPKFGQHVMCSAVIESTVLATGHEVFKRREYEIEGIYIGRQQIDCEDRDGIMAWIIAYCEDLGPVYVLPDDVEWQKDAVWVESFSEIQSDEVNYKWCEECQSAQLMLVRTDGHLCCNKCHFVLLYPCPFCADYDELAMQGCYHCTDGYTTDNPPSRQFQIRRIERWKKSGGADVTIPDDFS